MISAQLRGRWLAFAGHKPAGKCWLWTGAKDRDGYGVIADGRRTLAAHRVSYELHHRQLPPGSLVMHTCDTPACVNPEHLRVGTKRANAADMTIKGRRASKLDVAKVASIRARSATVSVAALALELDVSESTIRAVISRRSWR